MISIVVAAEALNLSCVLYVLFSIPLNYVNFEKTHYSTLVVEFSSEIPSFGQNIPMII